MSVLTDDDNDLAFLAESDSFIALERGTATPEAAQSAALNNEKLCLSSSVQHCSAAPVLLHFVQSVNGTKI